MKKIIFDRKGHASLLIINNSLLFSCVDSIYAGYIENDRVHDFNGSQRGWFIGGILRNLTGECVGFTRNTNSGEHPSLPVVEKETKQLNELPAPPLMPVSQESFMRPVFKKICADKNPTTLMIP